MVVLHLNAKISYALNNLGLIKNYTLKVIRGVLKDGRDCSGYTEQVKCIFCAFEEARLKRDPGKAGKIPFY